MGGFRLPLTYEPGHIISYKIDVRSAYLHISCFFQANCIDIFLISPQNHMLWYSLEASSPGASYEYPQRTFS